MNLTHWAQKHARSILFLVMLLAAGGAITALNLPVSLFPHITFPRLRVSVDTGDQPAERMAVEVTYPVEEALRAVPGVRGLRSTTSRGSAEVSIAFDWGADMVSAMLQAQGEVNRLLPSLPAGTGFTVERLEPEVFPSLAYSLISDNHSLVELRDLAQLQIRPVLSTVPGVSRVEVEGGQTAEYRVTVDPARLQSFEMTLDDVSKELSATNVLTAIGKLEDHGKLYLVVSDSQFSNAGQLAETVLRSGENGVVRLKEVATIALAPAPEFIRATADGHDAVLFQVYQQPGSNTLQIAKEIKQKLAEMRARLPNGVRIANWYDQGELITASAGSVVDSVLAGAVLAAIVLYVFLRNLKITLIAVAAVPLALSTAVLLLGALGMSFNIMTLGGMAAAVGLIIDDAIVMVEHIARRMRDGDGAPGERVLQAAVEFTSPLAGSSAATVVIFAPLAFLTGVTGAFFKALSLTMAACLIVSFLLAWLAVPILTRRVLTSKDAEHKEDGKITRRLHGWYARMMGSFLARPLILAPILAVVLLVGTLAYTRVGSGFIPSTDEGGFILDFVAPPGTSLTETDRLLRQVEDILKETPEVSTYSRRTGIQLGGGITEPNTGDFFIRLKAFPRRPIDEIMDEVRGKIVESIPGLEIETALLMEDLIGDLTAVPQPIEIKLFSDDEKNLEEMADKVAEGIGKVSGVVEVNSGIVPAGDALVIEVDRTQAGLEGLDPGEITAQAQAAVEGNITTQVQEGPKLLGVRVWIPAADRRTERSLGDLLIRTPDGHLVPLRRVASIHRVTGQPEIQREDLKRMVAVTARITGRDLGSTIKDLKRTLDAPGFLTGGTYYELGGLYKEQQTAFRGMIRVIIAGFMLVFLLLLFLYESFRVALAVIVLPVLALPAIFVGLWLTGIELNITAIMGMTMIIGILTEVAIFYYSEYNELADLPFPERFIEAGKNRMRPILMTTFAAILALLPLALGIGQGSAMQQPLAVAIIFGLCAQLPLSLVVLPVFLSVLRK